MSHSAGARARVQDHRFEFLHDTFLAPGKNLMQSFAAGTLGQRRLE